jgi:hypothetical protein
MTTKTAVCPLPDLDTIRHEVSRLPDAMRKAAELALAKGNLAGASWWVAVWYSEHAYPNTADRWFEHVEVFAGRLQPTE